MTDATRKKIEREAFRRYPAKLIEVYNPETIKEERRCAANRPIHRLKGG